MTQEPKVTRIHHIGVTVNDAQKAVEQWTSVFGCEGKVVDIPENGLRIGVVKVVDVTFFLNEYTDPGRRAQATEGLDLPVVFSGHRIVNETGEGISHISFETTDLDYMLDRAKNAGMRVRFEAHRDALEGVCNFIVPEDAHLPLEFMQAVEGRVNPLE
jgi:catechol 2,3-dioxygenase-like lactoylglutathione lyase family enzyme